MFILILFTKTPDNTNDKKNSLKRLPIGVFKKEQGLISLIYSIIGISTIIFISIIVNKYASFSFLYITIPLIFIFLIALLYISVKTSPLNIILNKMNITCRYNEMMMEFSKLKENNLHKDSLTLIKVCEANYAMAVDKANTNLIWNEIKNTPPSNNAYLSIFLQVEITIAINNKEYDLAKKLIDNLIIKYNKSKNIKKISERYLNIIKVEQSEEQITNVEELFPINELLLFTNINNAHGLMNYYNKWNIETESKKELANFIINSAPELTLLVQDADKILSI